MQKRKTNSFFVYLTSLLKTKNEFVFRFSYFTFENEKRIRYPFFVRKFENEKGKNGIYTDRPAQCTFSCSCRRQNIISTVLRLPLKPHCVSGTTSGAEL